MSMRGRQAAQGALFMGFGSTTMCLLIICCVFGDAIWNRSVMNVMPRNLITIHAAS